MMTMVKWVVLMVSLLLLQLPAQFHNNLANVAEEEKDLLQAFYNTYRLIKGNSIYTNHVNPEALILSAISGMVDSLNDPYSVLLRGKALDQFYQNLDNHYSGIGIYIVTNDMGFLIVDVIEESPAWIIGLRAEDLIIKVGKVEIKGKKTDEVRNLIMGPENSLVNITVLRGDKELSFNVVRRNIKVRTVQNRILPQNPKITYIRIHTFAQNTTDEFIEALDWSKSQMGTGMIIDVRNNPGGLLPVVIKMVDAFIANGTVVSTRSVSSPQIRVKADPQINLPTFIPVAVLVNRYSASASEIFAGALKDHRRAVIIGENSFGKFSIQKVFPIWKGEEENVALKLTIAKYFLPSGDSFDKIGISPHITITEKSLPSNLNQDEQVDQTIDTAVSIITNHARYRQILGL